MMLAVATTSVVMVLFIMLVVMFVMFDVARWCYVTATMVFMMVSTIAVMPRRSIIGQVVSHTRGTHGDIAVGTGHTHEDLGIGSHCHGHSRNDDNSQQNHEEQ